MTTATQFDLFQTDGYTVRPVNKRETHWWMLNIHYAKRVPPLSYAFGLFRDSELVGVITYGQPASPPLCKGIAGEENKHLVLELNRLVLRDNLKNEASRLIAQSLKQIPTPRIVVSYADTEQDHVGVVYQATNWLYTGCNDPRKDWAVRGRENTHVKALMNEYGSLKALQEAVGDDFYWRQRSVKHRYVMLLGNKTEKKALIKALKYPILPYPKKEEL